MEASSRTFGGSSRATGAEDRRLKTEDRTPKSEVGDRRRPEQRAATTSKSVAAPAMANAPSVTLPLAFILTGVAALLAGMLGLVSRPDLLAT